MKILDPGRVPHLNAFDILLCQVTMTIALGAKQLAMQKELLAAENVLSGWWLARIPATGAE